MNNPMTLEEFKQTPSLEMKNIGSKLRAKMSHGVNNITLIQPLQVEENKIEKEIAKRSRYYNYPPYGLGLIGRNLKKLGYNTHLVDLNYTVLKFIHDELTRFDRIIIAAIAGVIDTTWYVLVAILLAGTKLIDKIRKNAELVDRVIGIFLMLVAAFIIIQNFNLDF